MSKILNEARELMMLWGAFRASRVFLTANNYRVFDHLTRPETARSVSEKLSADLRATAILLDALAGIGLLKKSKDKYSNTAASAKFLVSGKPYYQGDILRHIETLWQNWSGLDEVIKTGEPSHRAHNHEAFILGMHNLALLKAKDVIKTIGLKRVKTALDLGAGPGTYSIELAKKKVKVTLFDRPETIAIAKGILSKAGVGNVEFIEGDFFHDAVGSGYDLIFASQIIHSGSENDNFNLIRKCKDALNKGGRLVIQEFYITKDLTHPAHSALFSVNMLVNTEGGRCYSPHEIKTWLSRAGFKTSREKIMGDTVLLQATNQ